MNRVLRIEVNPQGRNRKFLFKCPRWSILLNGHYTFQSDSKLLDLDALVEGLGLG